MKLHTVRCRQPFSREIQHHNPTRIAPATKRVRNVKAGAFGLAVNEAGT